MSTRILTIIQQIKEFGKLIDIFVKLRIFFSVNSASKSLQKFVDKKRRFAFYRARRLFFAAGGSGRDCGTDYWFRVASRRQKLARSSARARGSKNFRWASAAVQFPNKLRLVDATANISLTPAAN